MCKGRTARQRKKKRSTLKDGDIMFIKEDQTVGLSKWLKAKFNYCPKNLSIKPRVNAGNGVFLKEALFPGDVILSIPKSVMIGANEVYQKSKIAKSLLNYIERTFGNKCSLTANQLMCLYLIEEKRYAKDPSSVQRPNGLGPFISTLPVSFTHTFYWSAEELMCLPREERRKIVKIHKTVVNQFKALNKMLLMFRQETIGGESFLFKDAEWSEYRWAWCCINTRCVFSNHIPVELPGLCKTPGDNCYLIPFFDMLNHNPTAKIEASFNKTKQSYEVTTLSHCKKYDEVYLKYGEHSSWELLFEYGFVPETEICNSNDSVRFGFTELCDTFGTAKFPAANDALFKILTANKLHKDLTCVINTGPSWSLLVTSLLLACLQYTISNKHHHYCSTERLYAQICSGKSLKPVFGSDFQKIKSSFLTNISTLFARKSESIRKCIKTCDDLQNSRAAAHPVHLLFARRYLNICDFIFKEKLVTSASCDEFLCNCFY